MDEGESEADAEAIADALRTLYVDLRRFAAVVGPIEVDPDDMVQEAVVRLLAAGNWSGVRDVRAYLRRTIVNLASNERRRLGRQRAATDRLLTEVTLIATYPSDLSELGRLDPMTRGLLYLVEIDGYTIEEAALAVGCEPGAARTRLSRARRRLRSDLANEAVDD